MIVQDRLDPSGMFSKAGRLSLEMFTMLQEKEFVLTGKRRETQPFQDSHSSASKQQPSGIGGSNTTRNNNNDSLQDKHRSFLPRGASTSKSQPNLKPSPFSLGPTRDQMQEFEMKGSQNNAKFGMYQPKFHLIYEKSSLYPDLQSEEVKQRARDFQNQVLRFKKSPNAAKSSLSLQQMQSAKKNNSQLSQSIMSLGSPTASGSGGQQQQQQQLHHNDSSILNNSILSLPPGNHQQSLSTSNLNNKNLDSSSVMMLNSSVLGIEFDKPARRVVGPVALSKQCDRKPMINATIPHDKRFEFVEIPESYSKSTHMPNISFANQRRDLAVFGSKTGGLDYDVNYNAVIPRVNVGVLDYSKQTERKPPNKPVYTLNESIPDESYFSVANSNGLIYKKVGAPKFEKMAGRDRYANKVEEIDIDAAHK